MKNANLEELFTNIVTSGKLDAFHVLSPIYEGVRKSFDNHSGAAPALTEFRAWRK